METQQVRQNYIIISLTANLATTGGSTFGQSTGSSLFGGNNQPANTSGSLFGQPQTQPAGGSLFGNNNAGATGSSLFGSNQPQQQQNAFTFGGGAAVRKFE